MPFEKRKSSETGKATVTFRVPAEADANAVDLIGEFADWAPIAMEKDDGGDHVVTVDLDVGAAYRFRYRLDGDRWVNDWAADRYVANDYGGDDSVVDISSVGELEVPASAVNKPKRPRAPRKKAVTAADAGKGESKTSKADTTAANPKRGSRKKSSASTD